MACLIGGSIAAVAYLLGRAVESRRWLLAEVIWLRKTPPGVALYERQVALAHRRRVEVRAAAGAGLAADRTVTMLARR